MQLCLQLYYPNLPTILLYLTSTKHNQQLQIDGIYFTVGCI